MRLSPRSWRTKTRRASRWRPSATSLARRDAGHAGRRPAPWSPPSTVLAMVVLCIACVERFCIACVERCLDRARRAPTDDQTTAATPVPEALCVRPTCRHRENHPLVPCSRPARAFMGCPLRAPRRHEATRAIVRAPHGSIFGRAIRPDGPQDVFVTLSSPTVMAQL